METITDARTPDLSTYRTIHACLRVAAHRMAGAARAGGAETAAPLARYWAGYAGEVLAHHRIEDVTMFPALVERAPAAAELMARTDADHDHLDELMEATTAALRAWADGATVGATDGATDGPGTGAEAADRLDEVAAHMDSHLGFEDEHVLPLFERHFTFAEYEALDAAAVKDLGIGRQAAFTIPFVMHWASPEAQATMLAGAPLPLKVIHRLTRRGHARLTAAALGPFATPEEA